MALWNFRRYRSNKNGNSNKGDPIDVLYSLFVKAVDYKDYESMLQLENLANFVKPEGYKELRSRMFVYFITRMQNEDAASAELDAIGMEAVPIDYE